MGKRGQRRTTHHLYWPRSRWSSRLHKHKIDVPYDIHQTYHNQFYRLCLKPENRRCFTGFCQYEGICIYCGTLDTF